MKTLDALNALTTATLMGHLSISFSHLSENYIVATI